jgi:hypothetical protein
MKEFRTQNPETWIELTFDVAWRPYSKDLREAKNRLTQDLRSAQKIETGSWMGDKVESLTRLIVVARSVQEKPSYNFVTKETMADRLIMMVNVAADDLPRDGLSKRQHENIYPMDEDDSKLMKMWSSKRGSVITKEILARQ